MNSGHIVVEELPVQPHAANELVRDGLISLTSATSRRSAPGSRAPAGCAGSPAPATPRRGLSRVSRPAADVLAVEFLRVETVDRDDDVGRRLDVEEDARQDVGGTPVVVVVATVCTGSMKSGSAIAMRTARGSARRRIVRGPMYSTRLRSTFQTGAYAGIGMSQGSCRQGPEPRLDVLASKNPVEAARPGWEHLEQCLPVDVDEIRGAEPQRCSGHLVRASSRRDREPEERRA